MAREINYSKEYPTAWKEGYKRGYDKFNQGFNLRDISTKSRFKDFMQKLSFKHGILDGWLVAQEVMNDDMNY